MFPQKKFPLPILSPEDIDACFIPLPETAGNPIFGDCGKPNQSCPEIIDEIVADALAFKASDIHFEPQEKEVVVRFPCRRGVAHEAGRFTKEVYENILNRIKVQAHLRIDEHFAAQDGAIRFVKEKITVDMRVSVIPILDGEKITIRLLAEYVKGFYLCRFGCFPKRSGSIFKCRQKAIRDDFGYRPDRFRQDHYSICASQNAK